VNEGGGGKKQNKWQQKAETNKRLINDRKTHKYSNTVRSKQNDGTGEQHDGRPEISKVRERKIKTQNDKKQNEREQK
jgi:hypothetical protein